MSGILRFLGYIPSTAMVLFPLLPYLAAAQSLPGSSDPGRIEFPDAEKQRLKTPDTKTHTPSYQVIPGTPPVGAEGITLNIHAITIEGATAFSPESLSDIYAPYLNRDITLDSLWMIAGEITQRYRAAGYFLSRAYVPEQEIADGHVTIRVAEGYIEEVALNHSIFKRMVIQKLTSDIKQKKPLDTNTLERFLLQLNDLPGISFRAVVEPLQDAPEGGVMLRLLPQKVDGKGSVSFDNHNSRFLGPHQASASYSKALLPLQQTSVSVLASTPADELKYAALQHKIPLLPGIALEFYGSHANAKPGFTLEPSRIESESTEIGVGVSYQAIRQRQENLVFEVQFEGKNTNSDISGTTLTKDRVRALRTSAEYNTFDSANAYHYTKITLSQGLDILGARERGELNLSRSEAHADFTKAEFYYAYQRQLPGAFALLAQSSGQWASGPLFSSEEFGVGGQNFGRAYDPSELTGDHGLAVSGELRYLKIPIWQAITFTPFAFYDIGAVWNLDRGQEFRESASSAGLGLYANHDSGINGAISLAHPLTYPAGTPLYGMASKDPRLLFRLSYDF